MSADPNDMTFDSLTSIYRVERSSTILTEVRKDLYPAMADLIDRQVKECERIAATNLDSIMYDGAAVRKKKIIMAVKGIIEMRMQKIVDMAVRSAMGANIVIDLLTPEEKTYFEYVSEASRKHMALANHKKTYVTQDITRPDEQIVRRGPDIEPAPAPVPRTAAVPTPVTDDIPLSEIPIDDLPADEETDMPDDEFDTPGDETDIPNGIPADIASEDTAPVIENPPKPLELPEDGLVTIRILEDIPPFSGPDRNYVLVKEDIVRMPSMMASALLNRGKASLVSML